MLGRGGCQAFPHVPPQLVQSCMGWEWPSHAPFRMLTILPTLGDRGYSFSSCRARIKFITIHWLGGPPFPLSHRLSVYGYVLPSIHVENQFSLGIIGLCIVPSFMVDREL